MIEIFGGSKGIRNKDSLKSALIRPYQTFEQTVLYPKPEDKAAAILESIIMNHPFIDGNKRIGYVLMRITLLENEMDVDASLEEKFEFIMNIAKGEMNFEQIQNWIQSKLIKNVQ
ncbi:MAG: type II toxin-antitoxin system death-on-curing family toxin [Bacteroidota bacterium]|nr:type II toxin-antitoxin system death-on-curing family toxin [Bacteroidota bacterium]